MSGQEVAIYGFAMASAGCATIVCYPTLSSLWADAVKRLGSFQRKQADRAVKTLDELFIDAKPTWLKLAYGVGPLAAGLVTFLICHNVIGALLAAVAGLLVPDMWVRQAKAIRKKKFQGQLVDALLILSSSLRAGLSLTQAFEQLEAEMPPPASQEFGLMMKAHRLGRTLEDSLHGLNQRMASQELDLITTAMLVTRETGGDVTVIINQLVSSIREKKKLVEKISTLTLQGRLQAYIMSALPIVFVLFIKTFNPSYLDLLLNDEIGHIVIAVATTLWLIGMFLLMKMSKLQV